MELPDGKRTVAASLVGNPFQHKGVGGADCGGGVLTLYVDGNQIDSVTDTTYTKGDVGLFVCSGSNANAEVRFDDFVATKLPQE